jgi:deoxycytidine triphosphate deaminase
MLFVLSGPWGIGKSEAIKYLNDNYGFQTLIPWSTKVTEDQRGTKYNLLLNRIGGYKKYTEEQLSNMRQFFSCPFAEEPNDEAGADENRPKEIGFWCQPFINSEDFQVLGYRIAEILDVSNQNAVVIEADTFVAQQLKTASEKGFIGRVINIFLNYKTEDCFKQRLEGATNHTEYDRKRKKEHYQKETSFYLTHANMFEHCVRNDIVSEVIQGIIDIAVRFIRETPNMLHKKSGILSERDIQLAIKSQDISISIQNRFQRTINSNLQDEVYKDGKLDAKGIKSSSIDLFLSPECRVLRKKDIKQIDLILGEEASLCNLLEKDGFLGNIDINHADNLNRILQLVDDSRTAAIKWMFQEEEILLRDGLVLQPQEIVLCSSLENITIGCNIMALITSKYSFSQIGLSISLSQTILQPNHSGQVMLQLKNNLPYAIVIYPYMQIAQCVFFRTVSDSTVCCNYHEVFSLPHYDTSSVFKKLSNEIIRNKNWADINSRRFLTEQTEEARKKIHEKRAHKLFWLSFVSSIVGVLSLIANILTTVFL